MVNSPILIHLPHSSDVIPSDVRQTILLSEEELKYEILVMTDWYVDELFNGSGHDKLVNEVSRLVFDPERFRDDEMESMAEKGMGAIYTKTSQGMRLRNLSLTERENLLKKYYDSYHQKFEQLVEKKLSDFGYCLIVDAHSFSATPLLHERDKTTPRPNVCIGTDPFHTDAKLSSHVNDFFTRNKQMTVAMNSPYSGSIVPLKYYEQDKQVQSIMIELNRSLYMNEKTGEKSEKFSETRELAENFLKWMDEYLVL